MSKQKGHDYSTLLIWSAALVTVVRYAAAFIASDSATIETSISQIITYAMGLSGLGMGFLDVFGGAYLFDGWRRAMPKNGQPWPFRFKILTFFAISLIANGILILIPFTMSRVSGTSMHAILGSGFWLFGWSLVVNIAPYLLVGGVITGNQVVTVNSVESFRQVSDNLPAPSSANWRQIRKKLSNEDVTWLKTARTEEICFRWGIDDRTARNWRKYAQASK
jgi:hypothetical protein